MDEKPLLKGINGERDENGRFVEGWKGGPGRPPGRLSITDAQQKYYREHPEEFEKLLKEIRVDPAMRKLIWNYFDGLPKQAVDVTTAGKPFFLAAELMEKNDIASSPENNSEG